jgi:hypothetical protein
MDRTKALFFGVIALVFTAVLAAALVKALLLGDLSPLGTTVLLLLTASFGPKAIEYMWIFTQDPVAVQIDVQGLSGYKFSVQPWQNIDTVTALRGRKRHRYLGITLKDPGAYRAGLSGIAWLRARYWHWRYGQDIVVEGFLLKTDEGERIAQAAADFRQSTNP